MKTPARSLRAAAVFCVAALASAVMLAAAPVTAVAAEPVKVGVLKFGTVSWELDTIDHHGLDEKNGVEMEIVEFAGEDASNIALQTGAVDVIVSDWLWVSRQRSDGLDLTFAPFSSAVGAIMVPADSDIATLEDLKGKTLGVAGGPIDKSWLLIQGMAEQEFGFDIAAENEIVYGAPPLLAEKARQGELDAVLNYWHYAARLEANGFKRLVSAEDAEEALGATGPVSALGYVFSEAWAAENPAAIDGFLAASREAKALIEESDEEWQRLAPIVRAEGAELEALKLRFREGIPNRPVADEESDAALLYDVLAELGGERLVGGASEMAEGTYWPKLKNGS